MGSAKKDLEPIDHHENFPKLQVHALKDFRIKLVKYDLTDTVLETNFSLVKSFITPTVDMNLYPYFRKCFETENVGYILSKSLMDFESLEKCVPKFFKNPYYASSYLLKVFKFYAVQYDNKRVIASFDIGHFGCYKGEVPMPVILYFHMIYKKHSYT